MHVQQKAAAMAWAGRQARHEVLSCDAYNIDNPTLLQPRPSQCTSHAECQLMVVAQFATCHACFCSCQIAMSTHRKTKLHSLHGHSKGEHELPIRLLALVAAKLRKAATDIFPVYSKCLLCGNRILLLQHHACYTAGVPAYFLPVTAISICFARG